MRQHRVSPEHPQVINGSKKPSSRSPKEDESEAKSSPQNHNHHHNHPSNSGFLEPKPLRYRSTTLTTNPDHNNSAPPNGLHYEQPPLLPETGNHSENPNHTGSSNGTTGRNNGASPVGDVVLQWGQNKRSRGSRAENGSTQGRNTAKIQVRSNGSEKSGLAHLSSAAATTVGYTRGGNLRPCTPFRDSNGSSNTRHHDEKQSMLNGSPSTSRMISRSTDKRSPDKASDKAQHLHGDLSAAKNCGSELPQNCNGSGSSEAAAPEKEKVNMDLFEWPRIYISLSKKEKEDDFLAIKGTKLPQRPKKRPKNIDKNLQYCFPGTWLCDLSKGRYEVREKKSVKKRRRGLKGLENMDSDSE